jgi:hypothetical protein
MGDQSRTAIRYHIGIDPGVRTGVAVWDRQDRRFDQLLTTDIDTAWDIIQKYDPETTVIYIENPNMRRWFGKSSRERLQGAGSVKRDYSVWKRRLDASDYYWTAIEPKSVMSCSTDTQFKLITRYSGKVTSQHSRDAGMMVFGR